MFSFGVGSIDDRFALPKKECKRLQGYRQKKVGIPEARHPVRLNIRDEAKREARQDESPVRSVRYAGVLSRARLCRKS